MGAFSKPHRNLAYSRPGCIVDAVEPAAPNPPYRRAMFVSFFTPAYREAAERMLASLNQFRLDYLIEGCADDGDWQANTLMKPGFIWAQLAHGYDRPVVWVDADAVVRACPVALERNWDSVDIRAVRWKRPDNGRTEVLSGTVGFAPTPAAKAVLERWVENCHANPRHWDQWSLQAAILATPEARVEWLPEEYCWIFDTFKAAFPGRTPIIEHFQMSRQMRHRPAPAIAEAMGGTNENPA